MTTNETAINAVRNAIDAVNALGESKKVSAMVRKLTVVIAELEANETREKILSTLPKKGKKQE